MGVAWAGDASSYADFVARHRLTFANIDDTSGDVYARYGVPYQPAWVFIGSDGTATTMRGSLEPSALAAALGNLSGS